MDAWVTVAMTSFYRETSDLRCQLTAETIQNAYTAGYPTVIVDGSQNPAVTRYLDGKPGALVFGQQEPGTGSSRREVFAHAKEFILASTRGGDREAILWTEEKPDIIRSIPLLIAPIIAGEADIVIPKRTPEALTTWPQFQQESETRANTAYREATGLDFDPMFGPVMFSLEVADFFINCHPERYGVSPFAAGYIQHFAALEAIAAGKQAVSVTVDCRYPPAQREEEETLFNDAMREKRRMQEEELSDGYHIYSRALGIRRSQRRP